MTDDMQGLIQKLEEILAAKSPEMRKLEIHLAGLKESVASLEATLRNEAGALAVSVDRIEAATADAGRMEEKVRDRLAETSGIGFWRRMFASAALLILISGGCLIGYVTGSKVKIGDIAEQCAWTYTPEGQIAATLTSELKRRGIEPNPRDSHFVDWVAWAFSPQGLTAFQNSR